MYGTIMRATVKAGMREAFEESIRTWEQERGTVDGYHSTEVAWEDGNPDRVVMIVHFRDKESDHANANSPEQDAEYHKLVALLDGEPEWLDVHYGVYTGQGLPA